MPTFVPVYQYVYSGYFSSDQGGHHVYTWSPPDEVLTGYWCLGIAFYAPTTNPGGWTQLDRYVNGYDHVYATSSPGDGWTKETGTGASIFVAPANTAGTTPLYEYQSLNNSAIRRYTTTVLSDPAWVLSATLGNVKARTSFQDTYGPALVAMHAYAHMRCAANGQILDADARSVGNTGLSFATRLPLGLVGEAIATVAAMRMAQDGWFKLSDKAVTVAGADFGLPADSKIRDITMDDLLQHTSGLGKDKGAGLGTITSLSDYLEKVFQESGVPPSAVPGPYAYNFLDVTFLTAALDVVAQAHQDGEGDPYKDHVDYVNRVILAALGLDTDDLSTAPQPENQLPWVYTPIVGDGEFWSYDWQSQAWFPWLSWQGSAAGLLAFVHGIRTNRTLLSQASWNALTSGAYAWRKAADGTIYFGGDTYIGNDPNIPQTLQPGFAAAAACFTEADGSISTAVLLTNTRNATVLGAMKNAHANAT